MSSRLGTLFRWSWKLLTRQRLARLIIEPEPLQGGIQATQRDDQGTNGTCCGGKHDVVQRG
jgi:hypothetical protein